MWGQLGREGKGRDGKPSQVAGHRASKPFFGWLLALVGWLWFGLVVSFLVLFLDTLPSFVPSFVRHSPFVVPPFAVRRSPFAVLSGSFFAVAMINLGRLCVVVLCCGWSCGVRDDVCRVPCVIHCVLCLYVLVLVCLCSCVLCLCVRVCSCVPFLCRLCPIDGVRTHSLIIVTTYLALCCVCGAWCWWCCAFNSARCAALLCVSRLAQLVAWAWINLLHCWRLCFAFAFEPRMMWLGLLTFESGLNAGYATLCLSCGAARVQASMMDGLDWTDQTVNSAVVQENWVRMN